MLLSLIVMNNGLENAVLRPKFRVLGKKTDAQSTTTDNTSFIRLHKSCHHPKQCGLAGAVDTDEGHLLALLNGKIRIIEDLSFCEHLAEMLHV